MDPLVLMKNLDHVRMTSRRLSYILQQQVHLYTPGGQRPPRADRPVRRSRAPDRGRDGPAPDPGLSASARPGGSRRGGTPSRTCARRSRADHPTRQSPSSGSPCPVRSSESEPAPRNESEAPATRRGLPTSLHNRSVDESRASVDPASSCPRVTTAPNGASSLAPTSAPTSPRTGHWAALATAPRPGTRSTSPSRPILPIAVLARRRTRHSGSDLRPSIGHARLGPLPVPVAGAAFVGPTHRPDRSRGTGRPLRRLLLGHDAARRARRGRASPRD
ncbi:MAG: hypothetical protein KatS3mg065_0763 [Chloroflexota bacterium]|nr:MAG: hypothetical protein KatS3mg065_0763 [Chloroflexota bacterium]